MMKRLGDYIRPVDVRNRDLKVTRLLGVSITKEFMPSIANIVGTDLSTYKVVTKGQFAYGPVTSRNGDKISVALLDEFDDAIISQAYSVFEVIEKNALEPEYLMMWFRRPEFDRYARFKSHGSAREVFDWDEMCEVLVPIPTIEKQREIVAEYNTLQNRIETNKKLIATLEQTAQALYKHTFVDNIDPNNLPEGWRMGTLGEICSVITKGTTPSTEGAGFANEGVNFIKCESISESHWIDRKSLSFIDEQTHYLLSRSIIKENDIVFTIAGTLGRFAWIDSSHLPANTNQAVAIIRVNEGVVSPYFIMGCFMGGIHSEYCKRNVQQAVQANLNLGTLSNMPLVIANQETMSNYTNSVKILVDKIVQKHKELELLDDMQSLLLSKMGA